MRTLTDAKIKAIRAPYFDKTLVDWQHSIYDMDTQPLPILLKENVQEVVLYQAQPKVWNRFTYWLALWILVYICGSVLYDLPQCVEMEDKKIAT